MRRDDKQRSRRPQGITAAMERRGRLAESERLAENEMKWFPRGRGRWRSAAGMLVLLMIVPLWAMSRLLAWVDWRVVLEVVGTIWVVTYVMYHNDKRRAQVGKWRIPEAALHFWEMAGGWPAAYVAQRTLRHKIAKRSYQAVFWVIVSIHELVAADSLLSWRFMGKLAEVTRLVTPWLW